MISKEQYLELKVKAELANKNNDYSNMIMVGSNEHKSMVEYEQSVCNHDSVGYVDHRGYQICGLCKKVLHGNNS
jgi:hypothetical protein